MSHIETLHSTNLNDDVLEAMYSVALNSTEDSLRPNLSALEYIGDPKRFAEAHRHPSIEIIDPEGRRNNNQEYHGSRAFLAWAGSKLVAWHFTNHNVSGGGGPKDVHNTSPQARLNRGLKRLPPFSHDYLHLAEIYTHPDYQGSGEASRLLYESTKLSHLALPTMTPVAYVHMGVNKPGGLDLTEKLLGHGFWITNPDAPLEEVTGLGEVQTLRFQHKSVRSLHKQLTK